MSLIIDRLENVKRHRGKILARCPACAEEGADTTGDHLVVLESGKFGCAANPGDHKHRSRIFELAGDREPRETVLHLPNRRKSASQRVTFLGSGTGIRQGGTQYGTGATTPDPTKQAENRQFGTFGTGNSHSYAREKKQISKTPVRSQEKASHASQPKPPPYFRRVVTHGGPAQYIEDPTGECYLEDGVYYFRPRSSVITQTQ